MDADCSSKLACFSGACKNPCAETTPCGKLAQCSVVDTLPLRTMACLCPPGYVGDADVECKLGKIQIHMFLISFTLTQDYGHLCVNHYIVLSLLVNTNSFR